MEIAELSEWLKRDIDEIKADQKDQCKMLKDLNGRSRKNSWNIKAIWTLFGGGWAVFLLWLRRELNGG